MFEHVKESFASREEKVLEFWKSSKIFARSLENRKGAPLFSFYDGPPFATGLPHYGHILAGTIKDVIPRYKTMQGFYVPRRFGWDCHGLPVENEIEKEENLSGAPDIEQFGIAKFNEACRSIVLRYTEQWQDVVERSGRFVDFADVYKTMDLPFMESVWWVFSKLYEKGLVYEGLKVMPFSAKLGTPLSNFEANLNYKEVDDPSLTVLFTLEGQENTSLLAWTTTPWTLPSNLALGVGDNIAYVKIKQRDHYYIVAKERMSHYFDSNRKDSVPFSIEEEFLGKELVGKRYVPVFPHFASRRTSTPSSPFQILSADFVSLDEGTGIVHLAPAFGEVDFFLCAKHEIDPVCPIDYNGRFTEEISEYRGEFVKDVDSKIIRRLKEEGKVFFSSKARHRYPFCWRSDTPLIYRTVRTWFIAVEKIKDKLIEHNQKISWVPDHIKEGRFGKWLEQARDWAVSRNRYWGTPIPIWKNEDGKIHVIGSIAELERLSGKPITDLHRHNIDQITFVIDGQEYRRIPEVFDCWFESGSMPYAQNHYPFEATSNQPTGFPADFIAEGLDQTRGWFYTLHVLAAALFDTPAFTHVIVNGIILAEDGTKMSKRLKNYPEPQRILNEYGADPLRLFLLSSPVVYGDDMRFSEKGVEQMMRQVLIPLWNSYLFLSTYAEISKWTPKRPFCLEGPATTPAALIDRWLLSITHRLIEQVSDALNQYQLQKAVSYLIDWVEDLTNWYIRRSRSRFWSDEDSLDQREGFETLYRALKIFAHIAAPIIPFLSESIYQGLRFDDEEISVHCNFYPSADPKYRDLQLEEEMKLTQTVVSLGHALRKEEKLKVRQPLKRAYLVSSSRKILDALEPYKQLICEELNVHELLFSSDESSFVFFSCKPQFRTLGKKIGPKMGAVQKALAKLSQTQIAFIATGEPLILEIEGDPLTLYSEDLSIERHPIEGIVAKTGDDLIIALDTELTESLILEGIAREIVNKVNTMRRDGGFSVTDRIEVIASHGKQVEEAFAIHKTMIMEETLALSFSFQDLTDDRAQATSWEIYGETLFLSIQMA